MSDVNPHHTIEDWLKQRGYTNSEIERILAKLAEKDQKTVTDAVYDSIGQGTMTLDAIIRDALGQAEHNAPPKSQ